MIFSRLIPKSFELQLRWFQQRLKRRVDPELFWAREYFKTSGRVFLDVGANVGLYSIGLKKSFLKIHAFEPIIEASRCLKDYSAENIQVHDLACSHSDGEAEISIPIAGEKADYTGAGLEKQYFGQLAKKRLIKVTRIDNFCFQSVDLIKIDVEGHELSVVHGASETLRSSCPVVICELEARHVHNKMFEFIKMMDSDFGYQGYFLNRGVLTNLEGFSINKYQVLDEHGGMIRPYINNFIFIHRNRGVKSK